MTSNEQDEQYWQRVTALRLAVADELEALSDAQWDGPTLCTGWRVREVAGHLSIIPTVTSGDLLAAMPGAGFSLHRVNTHLARRYGAAERADVLARIRAHAADRTTARLLDTRNSLFDLVVHGQDVLVPLGRRFEVAPEVAAAGLDRVWDMGWPFRARRRLGHLRLVATDADWERGTGPEVRGSAVTLLLLLTGRTGAAAPGLAGQGVARLAGPA